MESKPLIDSKYKSKSLLRCIQGEWTFQTNYARTKYTLSWKSKGTVCGAVSLDSSFIIQNSFDSSWTVFALASIHKRNRWHSVYTLDPVSSFIHYFATTFPLAWRIQGLLGPTFAYWHPSTHFILSMNRVNNQHDWCK